MPGDHPLQRARELIQPRPGVEPQHERPQVHICGCHPRPAGGGRTCPPAAAPAGRCRPRSPPRRPPRPPPWRSARRSSSTSGSISGVICCAPAGIRFGGTAPGQADGRRRQPRRGRRLEQRPHRHLHPPLPQPLHQPHRQQRVPAQREEVIVGPDRVQAEHLREQAADDLLGHRQRPPAAACSGGVVRGGQRGAVQLPVGRQRQRVQHHDRGGHHVLGQPPGRVLPHPRGQRAGPAPGPAPVPPSASAVAAGTT